MAKGKKYVPIFARMHDLLFQMYWNVMLNKEDSKLWSERLKGVLEGWRALKEAGLLPEIVGREFYKDIIDAMGLVHDEMESQGIKTKDLAEHQKMFSFNLANLQNEFGAIAERRRGY